MSGSIRKISSHYLLTPQGLLRDRIVSVDRNGRIVGISETDNLDREAGVRFYAGIIIPGFVNAHCHLELSYLRGAIPPGGGFANFARGMALNRERHPVGERISAADYWDAKMWADGVSAVADICNDSYTFNIKKQSRIFYHSFAELFGLEAEPGKAFRLRDEAEGYGLTATVTPHSTYSLGKEAFRAAVGASSNSPLSIHFMETPSEAEVFGRCGDMWDWYSKKEQVPDFTDYGSPAQRIVAQVPSDRAVLLVHNCCVTQRDIDIVMGHFTAPVTWVLCPGSNRYISGGRPSLALLRRNGLRIAVGTDSLASNETLSMVREIGMLENVPLGELLRWATLNGAEALGLEGSLGSIETGKTPGLVLLSGVDMETMTLTPDARTERLV